MSTTLFILGCLAGGLGVTLGAFGGHALSSRLSPERLRTFETGVRYQMYHALALLFTTSFSRLWGYSDRSVLPSVAGWLFLAGILLFSGSLYLLALTGQRQWGAVTPFGGLAFIAGWMCFALLARGYGFVYL